MKDFYFNLKIGLTSFTFVFGYFGGVPELREIYRDDGSPCNISEVITAVENAHRTDRNDSRTWLVDTLMRALMSRKG